MTINSIKFLNFKVFTKDEFNFQDINFVKGSNGSGKSTLVLDALLFGLYGFTMKERLSDLPTRDKSKSCMVEINLNHGKSNYIIRREYPTKLQIKKDKEWMEFKTSKEAQNYLNDLFGTRENFLKFRTLDAYNKEANFLEEGQTTLKKIIFSLSDELFNTVRKKLTEMKHERELRNKDEMVLYKHFPSETRLKVLKTSFRGLNNQINELKGDIREIERGKLQDERQKSQLKERKRRKNEQEKALKSSKKCYACGQELPKIKQQEMLKNLSKEIVELEKSLPDIEKQLEMAYEIIEGYEKQKDSIRNKQDKLNGLINKLESRLKQKNYIYTNKDIIVVKEAIKELDNLSSYYLKESIKILEPIINNVLSKIGFEVKFVINDKGKFALSLIRDEIEYKYKDLSTGERLILQVGFKIALLLERGESNSLMICDEGASALDSNNIQYLFQLFQSMPMQLFVVLHHLEDIPENINVINLDKE